MAGGYNLAKHVLQVTINKNDGIPSAAIAAVVVQDTSTFIQTGFNLSPTSNDDIEVTYENGLLKSVTAKAEDKTADILVEIAKTAASFRKDEEPAAEGNVFEFDPFIPGEAIEVNRQLRSKCGICVEVEIQPGLWSPGCGKWSLGYKSAGVPPEFLPTNAPRAEPKAMEGLYYRRPVSHRVRTVRNGSTSAIRYLEMANNGPLFRVDIERTLFVTRETKLTFTNGELTNIQVIKPSEGLAIAQLPLKIAEAFLETPVLAFSDHKSAQASEANLNNARAAAILSDAALTRGGNGLAGEDRSGGFRSQELTQKELEDCRNIGFGDDRALCSAFLRRAGRQN